MRREMTLRKEGSKSRKAMGDQIRRIRGIVIPADWDEQGNVAALVIAAPNEEEYRVGMDKKGKELIAFLREEIEVSGFVSEKKNKKIVKVKEYSSEETKGKILAGK
jgi:hypothetical protein